MPRAMNLRIFWYSPPPIPAVAGSTGDGPSLIQCDWACELGRTRGRRRGSDIPVSQLEVLMSGQRMAGRPLDLAGWVPAESGKQGRDAAGRLSTRLEPLRERADRHNPKRSNTLQSQIHVSEKVLDGLDPHRESDQAVGETHRQSRLARDRGMRHRGGMADQALDAPQALGAGERRNRSNTLPPGLEDAVARRRTRSCRRIRTAWRRAARAADATGQPRIVDMRPLGAATAPRTTRGASASPRGAASAPRASWSRAAPASNPWARAPRPPAF